jgi:hypothetical protein
MYYAAADVVLYDRHAFIAYAELCLHVETPHRSLSLALFDLLLPIHNMILGCYTWAVQFSFVPSIKK